MAKYDNIKCVAVTTKIYDAHVSQEISNIKQSIVVLDSTISSVPSNLGSISYNSVSPVTNEIDKNKRKCNVVIFNLPDIIIPLTMIKVSLRKSISQTLCMI